MRLEYKMESFFDYLLIDTQITHYGPGSESKQIKIPFRHLGLKCFNHTIGIVPLKIDDKPRLDAIRDYLRTKHDYITSEQSKLEAKYPTLTPYEKVQCGRRTSSTSSLQLHPLFLWTWIH